MRKSIFVFLISCLVFYNVSLGQDDKSRPIDFIAVIEGDSVTSHAVGIGKLTESEKHELNRIMNNVYDLALEQCLKSLAAVGTVPPRLLQDQALSPSSGKAYMTIVDSDDDDLLTLENGAVVEVTNGYLGYIGYRKNAVLFKTGYSWRIWIEGKRAYKCELLREPGYASSVSVEAVYLEDVKGNGSILYMDNGSIWEVDDYYTLSTSLWIGGSEAIILNGYQSINLDEGDEVIEIMQLR